MNYLRTIARFLWYKTAVPVWLERGVIGACLTLAALVFFTNPMKFDTTQKITLTVSLVALSLFAAQTVHRHNEASRQAQPTPATPTPAPTPTPVESPAPDLVGHLNAIYPLTYDPKKMVGMPAPPSFLRPPNPEKQKADFQNNTVLFVAGTIKNQGQVPSIAEDFRVTFHSVTGRTIEAQMIVPSAIGEVIVIKYADRDVTLKMSDYWPRKMDMNAIPANGISYGFLHLALPGITPQEFDEEFYKKGGMLEFRFKDIRGKESGSYMRPNQ